MLGDAIVALDHQLLTAEEVAELLRLPGITMYDLARIDGPCKREVSQFGYRLSVSVRVATTARSDGGVNLPRTVTLSLMSVL